LTVAPVFLKLEKGREVIKCVYLIRKLDTIEKGRKAGKEAGKLL